MTPNSLIFSVIPFSLTSTKIPKIYPHLDKCPNCLYGINTRQLELLLWKVRPNSQTYLQECTIFFIQLNNVYNEINKCNMVLPPYVTPSTTRWHTSSDSMKPFEANIERKMLECQALLSSAVVPTF